MSHIRLHTNQTAFTAVSHLFIDDYMPQADGDFVKVYLYLLRCLTSSEYAIGIRQMAAHLDCTENRVLRSLEYWEEKKLLLLTRNKDGIIADITLCELTKPVPDKMLRTDSASFTNCHGSSQEGYTDQEAFDSRYKAPSKTNYSASQLEKFLGSEDISQILYIAQKYLGTTLSDTDTATILYFYDGLHFSAELIEYLIEYCVSIGQRSMRYIEKVALAWAEKGYSTVQQAKDNTTFYTKNCFAVMKAFGLSNRRPGNSEISMIQKWTTEYGFTIDIILEACNRTIRTIHQPSFDYADSILNKWKNQGVKHMADIVEQDKQFLKNSKQVGASQKVGKSSPPISNNRFNNVTPRSYAYEDLEKQLLN